MVTGLVSCQTFGGMSPINKPDNDCDRSVSPSARLTEYSVKVFFEAQTTSFSHYEFQPPMFILMQIMNLC